MRKKILTKMVMLLVAVAISTAGMAQTDSLANLFYQNISIADDGVGGARITNGENVSLRAVEYIELLPGFEVELGGELYADVHECDN